MDAREVVSFKELSERARLLGDELASERFLDGQRQQVVALLLPHSCNYVIAMLGIWRAAGGPGKRTGELKTWSVRRVEWCSTHVSNARKHHHYRGPAMVSSDIGST